MSRLIEIITSTFDYARRVVQQHPNPDVERIRPLARLLRWPRTARCGWVDTVTSRVLVFWP
jgi:hypothetical protein